MAKRFLFLPSQSKNLKFGEASFEILSDFLINLNIRNKDKLSNLSRYSGDFKDKRLIGKFLARCLLTVVRNFGQLSHCSVCALATFLTIG
jgi:hypothetical protein